MYLIMFEKFNSNQYMLHINGETLHNLTHNLENKINEKCFLVIELHTYYHFIKIAFITESGKFYLDNGEYLVLITLMLPIIFSLKILELVILFAKIFLFL